MSEALERLKDIGAQKVYEDTHIPVEHVQAILYESFEGLSKVQFVGFVSILEREYGEDLSDVHTRGIDYFDEKDDENNTIAKDTFFQSSKKKKKLTAIYLLAAIVLLVVAIMYTMESANKTMDQTAQKTKVTKNVNKNIIVDANSTVDANSSDDNTSNDKNISVAEDVNVTKAVKTIEPKAVTHTLKIIARTKVWLGYIDVATDQKYQKIFKGEFDLNPTKEWLLYFGHGYIDVVIDGKKKKFNSKNTLRLHYLNGKIEKISINDFKKLNRGNTW